MPNNIAPKNSIYFNASLIIKEISNDTQPVFSFWELYEKMKKEHNMTLNIFVMCLDWLYLIDHPKLSKIH